LGLRSLIKKYFADVNVERKTIADFENGEKSFSQKGRVMNRGGGVISNTFGVGEEGVRRQVRDIHQTS